MNEDFLIWMSAGLASIFMVTSVLIICAGFMRKNKPHFNSEPTLLKLQKKPLTNEVNGAFHGPNNQLLVDQRANSPSWRNSSLSRELPAIPDVNSGELRGDGRYDENASNLYACLDDVRVVPLSIATGHRPMASFSMDNEFVIQGPQQQIRVHPYDRIGAPSGASTSAGGVSGVPEPVASTSRNHAQVLQQMDNDAVYRGARSDVSYTSVTARAPLADLMTRRMSEDGGYTKVAGDENHLYAQVGGGEYSGSVGSELQGSAHIYNELYAEIDAFSNGPSHYGALINPYATSNVVVPANSAGDQAGPSNRSVATEGDRSQLYAKVTKLPRSRQANSFSEQVFSRSQDSDNAEPSSDTVVTDANSSRSKVSASSPIRPYVRREHVYEQIPDV